MSLKTKNCRFSLITQNMKLFVAFIAGTFADKAVREECPDYLNPDTKERILQKLN